MDWRAMEREVEELEEWTAPHACAPAASCMHAHKTLAGNDATGAAVAEFISSAISQRTSQSIIDIHRRFWLVDRSGLVRAATLGNPDEPR